MKGKIFNAQEVQAIIAGSKTMFREMIKNQTPPDFVCDTKPRLHYSNNRFFLTGQSYDWWFEECPYQVGQKIFVKESFAVSKTLFQDIKYLADNQRKWGFINNDLAVWKKRPAQYMKQEHSRLTLEITNIKVERLQDISEDDCLDEGCYFAEVFLGDFSKPPRKIFNFSKKNLLKEDGLLDYKLAFKEYWDAKHKKPEEKFKVNPFVWVVDFKINK